MTCIELPAVVCLLLADVSSYEIRLSMRGHNAAAHRWHDDKAHGWGMKAFANGDRHEGEYCLDLRQGCGTYHWANGDCYEGDWEVCVRVLLPLCWP